MFIYTSVEPGGVAVRRRYKHPEDFDEPTRLLTDDSAF